MDESRHLMSRVARVKMARRALVCVNDEVRYRPIYIYMYIYMHKYIYINVFMYIYVYIHIST